MNRKHLVVSTMKPNFEENSGKLKRAKVQPANGTNQRCAGVSAVRRCVQGWERTDTLVTVAESVRDVGARLGMLAAITPVNLLHCDPSSYGTAVLCA